MRQIRIEIECSTMIPFDLESSEELILSYSEGARNAELYDVSDESDRSVQVEGFIFQDIWDRMMEVDFTKVIKENEYESGFDGFSIIIHLETEISSISVSLWCPSEERYRKKGCTESAAVAGCMHEILKLGSENGFKFRIG